MRYEKNAFIFQNILTYNQYTFTMITEAIPNSSARIYVLLGMCLCSLLRLLLYFDSFETDIVGITAYILALCVTVANWFRLSRKVTCRVVSCRL